MESKCNHKLWQDFCYDFSLLFEITLVYRLICNFISDFYPWQIYTKSGFIVAYFIDDADSIRFRGKRRYI